MKLCTKEWTNIYEFTHQEKRVDTNPNSLVFC